MASATQRMPSGAVAILAAASSTTDPTVLQPTRTALALFGMQRKVAVVTGGARGIGLEIAVAYAEAGAVVYGVDLAPHASAEWTACAAWVDALPAQRVGAEVAGVEQPQGGTAARGRMVYVQGDVTQQQAMWDLFAQIAEKEGRLDVCVASAGILRGVEVLEYPGEEWNKLLAVNVNGALFAAQAAGRQMAIRGIKGSIILIASMSGSITNPGMHWAAYNTSKAAVIQLARSIACELGSKGIRCNTISPGYIYTDMTKHFLDANPELVETWCKQNPLGRLANPDELRGVALFLGTDASSFCTGSDLIVDGGQTAW